MKLEDLEIYQIAMKLGDDIWDIVIKWPYFEKNGLGKQWTDAADSIASNISEGYGRMSARDNRRFCIFARGSLYETTTWLKKTKNRNLVDEALFQDLDKRLHDLKVKLWNYIQALERRIKEENNKTQ
jgi:four helix bundle protein